MTHRNQLRGFLGGADAGKARHFQRITFGIIWQLLEHAILNSHKCLRDGGSLGFRFGGYVYHAGAAFFVVVGKFSHGDYLRSTRISSPTAHSSRSGLVTRKALQRARAPTSPDPWDSSVSTTVPSALSRAGRKRVSPVFCR